MVSTRCKMAVKEALKKLGLHFIVVDLGEIEIMETISDDQRTQLKLELVDSGLELSYDYTYLSNIFSEVKGITIQHYIISHKIERIKELLMYDELNLTEISYKLHYSSVAHLSNQFKKITGLTPSQFKNLKDRSRKPLEDIGN